MKISLRPHHGLCIKFYRGKGYSDEFTANMDKIIPLLENGGDIVIVSGGDALCSHCPNYDGRSCASGEKPEGYDAAVLSLAGLKSGDKLKWNEFKSILDEKVFAAGKFDSICSNCEWSCICHGRDKK